MASFTLSKFSQLNVTLVVIEEHFEIVRGDITTYSSPPYFTNHIPTALNYARCHTSPIRQRNKCLTAFYTLPHINVPSAFSTRLGADSLQMLQFFSHINNANTKTSELWPTPINNPATKCLQTQNLKNRRKSSNQQKSCFQEPPVISVKPVAHVQVHTGSQVISHN